MRTKNYKLDGETLNCFLQCGGPFNGLRFKIYTIGSKGSIFLLVIGKKKIIIPKESPDYSITQKYVCLKYHLINEQPQIKLDFFAMLERINKV